MSRINGLLWMRGIFVGYDFWVKEFGLIEWSWGKVELFFEMIEEKVL